MPYKSPTKKHCFKMKASAHGNNPMKKNFPGAFKFNAELKAASAAGKLDNNPKFKAAVDNSPAKMYRTPAKKYKSDAQRKAVHASKAEKSAVKKKGCAKCAYGKKKCTCM